MKKSLFLLFVTIIFLAACTNKKRQNETPVEEKNIETASIEEILEIAEENIGKEVHFHGIVSHVCVHSGRRCILVDTTGKLSLRVEATGEIKGFNRELAGTIIAVKGIVQEKRLSAEFIQELEQKIKAKEPDIEEGGKHCSAELDNITSMRDWMKKNSKNYYSIYFINGIDYEVLD